MPEPINLLGLLEGFRQWISGKTVQPKASIAWMTRAWLGKSRKWTGSAERQAAGDDNQTYLCDLNNDGTEEQYQKAVWLSSNIYTEDGLQDYRGCRNRHSAAQRNAGVKGPGKPERKSL